MKTATIAPIIVFVLLATITPIMAQTKRALVIAVGEYKDHGAEKTWPGISSVNDTSYMLPALRRQGFDPQHTQLLLNDRATMQGMRGAFTSLTEAAQPGDAVVIHISAHGAQLEDDNGDEIDGLDESIVSYDAQLPPTNPTTAFDTIQQDYFRDDEFGNYMQQLRERLGPDGDIVVFMDNCHSGSGTRGAAKVRGGAPPLLSPAFKPGAHEARDTGVFGESNAHGQGNGLASYVVISASRAEELNYETRDENGNGVGSLTYAISKSLENLSSGITYRSFFAQVQTILNQRVARQNPVIEGTGLDRQLFGGEFVQQAPYFEISRIAPNRREIEINAGLLHGVVDSSVVSIVPSGTPSLENASEITAGTVVRANRFSALVRLDSALDITQSERAKAWVFLKSQAHRIAPLVLSFADPAPARGSGSTAVLNDAEIKSYKDALADLPLVSFEGEPDLVLVRGEHQPVLTLAADGQAFSPVADAHDLQAKIKDFARYQYLRSLQPADNSLQDIDIKLVPIINGVADTSAIAEKMALGQYAFADGDSFALWITNKNKWPVYVNVLDLQPNGIINPIFPNTQIYPPITPEELRIEGGGDRLFEQFPITVGPPYGIETFLFFTSRQLLNLEQVATSPQSQQSRGALQGLEALVALPFDDTVTSRGGSSANTRSTQDGNISTVVFSITEHSP